MSNIPLGPDLKTLFDDVTTGKTEGSTIRAILVQNDSGTLRLVDTLPEGSTDKEDFSSVLGKLFSKEPSKPGYALYRLDSKSPAGLFEWLNCAYRPEGAKVREKMQYAITQASLFQGLNEQHFLETVYGGSISEFAFPTRLRNQRKHDYQNPQQSIAGKKAAEAAGTGTAGRRNFDKIPSPGAVPQRGARVPNSPPLKAVPDTSTTLGVTQHSPAVTLEEVPPEDTRPPTPPEIIAETQTPPPTTSSSKEEDEKPSKGEIKIAQGIANGEGVDVDASKEIASISKEENEEKESKDAPPPEAEKDIQVTASSLAAIEATDATSESHEVIKRAVTPPPPGTLTKEAGASETLLSKNDAPAVAGVLAASGAIIQETTKQSSASVGTGNGSQGLETERERHLSNLKSEEQKLKNSGSQGGSHVGFSWQDDVEPALRGLAKKLGGTSEWNLVVLKIDLQREEIELAFPPRFVPPGDLSETFSESEPCYAFYLHPDVQKETDESSQVAIIYVCPLHSSIRQRMLYSANLALTSNRVGAIQGLDVLKRIETSDPKELTAAFFAEELLGEPSTDAGQAKALSRPKRPGRK